jgi:hypothetical protein
LEKLILIAIFALLSNLAIADDNVQGVPQTVMSMGSGMSMDIAGIQFGAGMPGMGIPAGSGTGMNMSIFPPTSYYGYDMKSPGLNTAKAKPYGYYDINLNFHFLPKDPMKRAKILTELKPGPLAVYENFKLKWKDKKFIKGIPEKTRHQMAFYINTPPANKYMKLGYNDKNKSYDSFYTIGKLRIKAPKDSDYLNRFTLKSAILKVTPKNYPEFFPKYKKLIEQFKAKVKSPSFNRRLRRETPGKDMPPFLAHLYAFERLQYTLQSFSKDFEQLGRKVTYHLSDPPKVSRCTKKNQPAYQFSIAPFKRGDLDNTCKTAVDNGVKKGFGRVTLHWPVPYSGGNAGDGLYKKEGTDFMRYGWDYQYEDGMPQAELHRCLDYITKAGLELNFVPHLGSIVTLNANGEAEWRIVGDIPIDDNYYMRSYWPLLTYIKKNKKRLKGTPMRIAAAAELDPTFLGGTGSSLSLMKRLRKDFTKAGVKPEITWNPNGDFFHKFSKIATKTLDCMAMPKLFKEMDRIAPSMYEGYGHIVDGSFKKSKDRFFKRLYQKIATLCPAQVKEIKKIVKKKPFSAGEFTLEKTSYKKFHDEMMEYRRKSGDKGADAAFWNSGRWDHAGILKKSTKSNKKLEITSAIGMCRMEKNQPPIRACAGKESRNSTLPNDPTFKYFSAIYRRLNGR